MELLWVDARVREASSAQPSPPRTGRRTGLAGALGAALLLLGSCAGLGTEQHLAPLYTRVSPAGGGVDTELLGGALRSRSEPYTGRTVEWAFRPFFSMWPKRGSDYEAHALPPFGYWKREGLEKVWRFLPLFRYASGLRPDAQGRERWTWSLLALPAIYMARDEEGRRVTVFFPFGGSTGKFLGFDEIEFVLFPIWARTRRAERIEYHFLWPFFAWTNGAEGRSWRVWPLIGRNHWEGHYDRWFLLWPFLHWQTNRELYGEDQEEHRWMAWPFLGRSRRAGYTSTTFLWPFFGYAEHESNGYWSWDGPWPLVRLLEPGETDGPRRRRFWPFYSRYEGDGLESTWYLWPFVNRRHEHYGDHDSDSSLVIPFWHADDDVFRDEDGTERRESYRRLWPLYRVHRGEDSLDFAAPALNPLWRMPVMEYHYAWLWQLYTYRREADEVSQRSWLGLWRRETDMDEDRNSIAGLYASRAYTRLGRRVVERSLLFGLLRWRMDQEQGFELMSPALPGPGWPLERVPNSILPPPVPGPDRESEEL